MDKRDIDMILTVLYWILSFTAFTCGLLILKCLADSSAPTVNPGLPAVGWIGCSGFLMLLNTSTVLDDHQVYKTVIFVLALIFLYWSSGKRNMRAWIGKF